MDSGDSPATRKPKYGSSSIAVLAASRRCVLALQASRSNSGAEKGSRDSQAHLVELLCEREGQAGVHLQAGKRASERWQRGGGWFSGGSAGLLGLRIKTTSKQKRTARRVYRMAGGGGPDIILQKHIPTRLLLIGGQRMDFLDALLQLGA